MTLYVHLPWCVRKCPYCDFNSHEPRGAIPELAYVDALLADLDSAVAGLEGRAFASVYFGGGTPSLFAPGSIERVLQRLRERDLLLPDAEVTLEANPGTVDEGHFEGYRAAGVNRLSLGVQSFDDESLRTLGRIHGGAEARRAAGLAARTFTNFNLDLMYGLPGQSRDLAVADVDAAIATGATHLSCYQLTLEPNTVFAKYPPELPDDSVQAAIESAVLRRLDEAGYRHYEVSAHARPGGDCRHNRHYWTFADYLGIGAGAHSKLTQGGRIHREARVRGPEGYRRRVGSGRHIVERREVPGDQLLAEFMMNALRLTGGFDLSLMRSRTGLVEESVREPLARLSSRGLVCVADQHVRPTDLGRRFLNQLVAAFLES